jgi:hypothetical protein
MPYVTFLEHWHEESKMSQLTYPPVKEALERINHLSHVGCAPRTFSDAEYGPDTDFDDDLFSVRFAVIEHTGVTVHWAWYAVRTLRLEPAMSNYRPALFSQIGCAPRTIYGSSKVRDAYPTWLPG